MAKKKIKKTKSTAGRKASEAKSAAKKRSGLLRSLATKLWQDGPATDLVHGRSVFYGLFAVLALSMLVLASKSGINGDEDIQDPYSDAIVDYYTSFGADKTLYNLPGVHPDKQKMIKYYGAIYELPAGVINGALGFERKDRGYHTVRHMLSALFGLLTLLFAGRIAHLFGGWRAAICTLLVLGLAPRFFGHSLINPKDIPFAMGNVMSLYYLLRVLKTMPTASWRYIILLGAGIGIAISSRAGGVLLIAYAGMFMGISFLVSMRSSSDLSSHVGAYAKAYFASAVIGLVLGTLFWPYALDNPFSAIPDALAAFTNFPVNIRILFSGDMIFSTQVGWRYIPEWWLVCTPIVMLLGLALAIGQIGRMWTKYPLMPIAVLGFSFLFPIAYTMYKSSAFYGGMRHMLFAYCSAAILAGIGWSLLWERLQSSAMKWVPVGLMAVLLLEPAVFIARNSHAPYVFFNMLSGGVKSAQGVYELDTQGIAVKQGLDWLIEHRLRGASDSAQVIVTSNYSYSVVSQLPEDMKDRIKPAFSHYRQRFDKEWDYAIYVCHFIDGAYLRAGTFPGGRAIHNVEVGGVPIVTVLERGDEGVFDAMKSLKVGDLSTALPLLQQETTKYPKNDVAWTKLGNAYLQMNRQDDAQQALEKALELSPGGVAALNDYGTIYLQKGDLNKASDIFERSIKANQGNAMGYFRLASIYQTQGDLTRAVENAKLAVGYAPSFKPAYQLAADIFKAMGDERQAAAYLQAMNKR